MKKKEYCKPDITAYDMCMEQCLMAGSKKIGTTNSSADPDLDVLSLDDEENEGNMVCW